MTVEAIRGRLFRRVREGRAPYLTNRLSWLIVLLKHQE